MGEFDISMIPNFPPLAFPIPVWLSKILLVVGFFLHAIPMNIVLGGTLLAAVLLWRNSKFSARAGKALVIGMPVILSFAITQGVVPLLFLQLIYGPLYYSSSVLMAVPWLSIIVTLTIAYYLLYIVKFREKQLTSSGKNILLVAGIIFLSIAFLFSNNMTLMINPGEWSREIVSTGMNLNLHDPQLLPRYLHFVVAAIAISGVYLGVLGLFEKDKAYATWLIKTGAMVYLIPTLLQFLVGSWFLMSISKPIMMQFMGGDMLATATFGLSLLLTIVSVIAAMIAWNKGSSLAMIATTVSSVLTVLTMIIVRHFLRTFTISDFIKPELLPVSIQWDILIAFLVLAVGLIIYLVWLVKLTLGALRK